MNTIVNQEVELLNCCAVKVCYSKLIGNVKNELDYDMEITLRTDKSEGFKPLPKRWVVERTFAWLENFRRLAKDYEYKVSTSETMIMMAFIMLMVNRIN